MSIPERFYRIARHKFTEIKERIEDWDREAEAASLRDERERRLSGRTEAGRELDESLGVSGPAANPRNPGPAPLRPAEACPASAPAPVSNGTVGATDPLLYHYRLLGVEPGSDFDTVQFTYLSLSARCDPARFPAGSQEASDAEGIRQRLESSFRVLRDALDPTARRFGHIEFDDPTPPDH